MSGVCPNISAITYSSPPTDRINVAIVCRPLCGEQYFNPTASDDSIIHLRTVWGDTTFFVFSYINIYCSSLIFFDKFFNVTIDYLLGQESNNKQINISNQELESFTKLSNDLSKTINNIKIKNGLITNSTINTVNITYKNNPKKE